MKDLVLTRKDLGCRVNYSGQYVFMGFKFNFTYNYNCVPIGDAGQLGDAGDVGAEANRQGKPGRGKVTLVSPLDNKICMFDGPKARRIMEKLPEEKRDKAKAGERIPELLMYKDFISHDNSEKAIEEIVAKKAKEIFAENEEQMRRIVGKMGESAATSMDLMSAYMLYGKKFLATKYSDTTEKVKNENRRALEKISTQLCGIAISDLGVKDINKIIKILGSRADRKLSVAENFFDYCIDKKIVRCDNPFSDVKKSLKKTQEMQRLKLTELERFMKYRWLQKNSSTIMRLTILAMFPES